MGVALWCLLLRALSSLGQYFTFGASGVVSAISTPLESESESRSVVSDSLPPHRLYSPWNSPGHNTGVGSLSLLQKIFPTQKSNPGFLHCRRILYQLSHKGSSWNLKDLSKSRDQIYWRVVLRKAPTHDNFPVSPPHPPAASATASPAQGWGREGAPPTPSSTFLVSFSGGGYMTYSVPEFPYL